MKHATQGFSLIELLIAVTILGVVTVSISSFLLSNIRHGGKLQADQALTATARDYMEAARHAWSTSANFDDVTKLPAAPADCVRQVVTPTVTVMVGTTPTVKTLASRQVTLRCTKNGYSQSFSLEIPKP